MNTEPQRILIIRIDRIGDLFTTTPAIKALRLRYPDARIDMVASDGNHIVVRDNPHLDNVYVFHPNKPWRWPLSMLKLRANRYDWVIAFNRRSKTTAVLARATGAPMRAAFHADKTAGKYTHTFPDTGNIHMVDNQLQLAAELGAPSADTSLVFPVRKHAAEQAQMEFPRKQGLKRIGVFIGNAKKQQTRWPADRFQELVQRLLKEREVEIYIIGGPGDEPLFEGFEWNERCLRYPGGSLESLGAFMQTCDLMVTSSTGPMHLAAAVGAPMVSILAEHTYHCWRPLGEQHTNLNSGHPGVDVRGMEVRTVLEAVLQRIDEMG